MNKNSYFSHIDNLITAESTYQKNTLSLVASDNYASEKVLRCMATPFNNKCAEEYPQSRTYAGLHNFDKIEQFAIDASKDLFDVNYANVQAYSGSNANLAVFNAFMKPGDVFMGMSTNSGGHYSHGYHKNLSSHFFTSTPYHVDSKTGLLDFDMIRDIAKKVKPKLIISGASYYPREIDFSSFEQIAKEVGAKHLCDMSHISGLIIAGKHLNPFPYSDAVTTTTHKMLRGPRGALILSNRDFEKELNQAMFPFTQGSCHMHKVASIAVCLNEASNSTYCDYITKVLDLAQMLAQMLLEKELTVLTGGTDTHMVIVKTERVEQKIRLLETLNILASPVTIGGDKNHIRFGTCAMASRNIPIEEAENIFNVIINVLCSKNLSDTDQMHYSKLISDLCIKRPIPKEYI